MLRQVLGDFVSSGTFVSFVAFYIVALASLERAQPSALISLHPRPNGRGFFFEPTTSATDDNRPNRQSQR